jgi:hypothetical protein
VPHKSSGSGERWQEWIEEEHYTGWHRQANYEIHIRRVPVRSTVIPDMCVGGLSRRTSCRGLRKTFTRSRNIPPGLGVHLVIEPMSRFRIHLVNTAAQAVNLVRLAAQMKLPRGTVSLEG